MRNSYLIASLAGALMAFPCGAAEAPPGKPGPEDLERMKVREESQKMSDLLASYRRIMRGNNLLTEIPKEIVHPPNQVSLVADPRQQLQGRILIYLVNATSQPFKNGIRNYQFAQREVKTPLGWLRCDDPQGYCGNVTFTREDLPAGQVAILASDGMGDGEVEAEIRYVFPSFDLVTPPVVSKTYIGYCRAAVLERARRSYGRYIEGPIENRAVPRLQARSIPLNREEYVACLEILRSAEPGIGTRVTAEEILKAAKKQEPASEFAQALEAVLQREWSPRCDRTKLFTACLSALEAGDADGRPYGDPRSSPLAAWVLLAPEHVNMDTEGMGPEQWSQHREDLQRPWGADEGELRRMVEIAKKVMSRPSWEGQAARNFLLSPWMPSSLLTNEELEAHLDSDSPELRCLGFMGLRGRGRLESTSKWLATRVVSYGDEAMFLWEVSHPRESSLVISEDEAPVAAALLQHRKEAVLRDLIEFYGPAESLYRKDLPAEIQKGIRSYLEQELKAPDLNVSIYLILDALEFLDWSRDPQDARLLLGYLQHPGLEQNRPRPTYVAREKAKHLLIARGIPVPDGVVIYQEDAPAAVPGK